MNLREKDGPKTDAPPVTQNDATTQASYQVYFTSGYYDRRYPSPNRSMWTRITTLLRPGGAVLDFGCGSGRYLLGLQGLAGRAIGFDVSKAALATLRQKAKAHDWHDLQILGPEASALDGAIDAEGPVDLVLCLFGVLGHITDPGARADALRRMRRALKPELGRMLISVPNKARRFRAEQADAVLPGLVRYSRRTDDGRDVALNYQLFEPDMLIRELTGAGFDVHRVTCESVLPESWLLHNAAARALDAILTPICPARWGYGICAEVSC